MAKKELTDKDISNFSYRDISSFMGDKDENITYINHNLTFRDCIFRGRIRYKTNSTEYNSNSIQKLIQGTLLTPSLIKTFCFINCIFINDFELIGNDNEPTKNEIINQRLTFTNCEFIGNFTLNHKIFKEKVKITKCEFHGECNLESNTFEKEIRLCGTKFLSKVTFAESTINELIVFSTPTLEDKAIFKENVSFSQANINCEINFSNIKFEKDIAFIETKINNKIYLNKSRIDGSLKIFNILYIKHPIYLNDADINNLSIEDSIFENLLILDDARIENITIIRCILPLISLTSVKINKTTNEETARVLKNEALKGGNTPVALLMRCEELKQYSNSLEKPKIFSGNISLTFKKCGKYISEKTPLELMRWSNGYGTKWMRAIVFILTSTFVFFSLFIMLKDGIGSSLIWGDINYWKEAAKYIMLFDIAEEMNSINSIPQLIVFLLGKIFILYGIYQLIAAFRKHGR